MRKRLAVAGIVVIVVVVGWAVLRTSDPRGEAVMETRVLSPKQLLELAERSGKPWRLRTTRDVLPGGNAAAMAPMIINWNASDPYGPDPFVVMRNLNYGGNPYEGTTVLQSVRIPLDGVESAEFTLIPLGPAGKRGVVQHGQLRFVFKDDHPCILLDAMGSESGGDATLGDLVFSWEAWRPPGVAYDVLKGMDARTYDLTLRAFGGPQRFLEDQLGGRDWYSHVLRLPGGAEGLSELLKVTLALGDGIARHTLSHILETSEEDWLKHAPTAIGKDDEVLGQWRKLREIVQQQPITPDARLDLPEEERGYQSLLRSCATMAYYSINVAVNRLLERGIDDGVNRDKLDAPSLGGDHQWMQEISDADLAGVFMRAPYALKWLRANPQTLPTKIPNRLEEAGLLEHAFGRRVEIHYSAKGTSPYGDLSTTLIR